MFPLPYEAPLDQILYALFVLEWVLLSGGLLLGKLNAEQTGRLPRPLRMLLSGASVARSYALLVFLGMGASFVGDLIMARLIPVSNRLIFGMAAFAVGHALYLSAFVHLLRSSSPLRLPLAGIVLVAVLAFGICAWYRWVRNPDRGRAINVGSLFYGLLFGLSTSLAILLAVADSHYVGLAAGSLLFMLSDLVLGNWVIRGHIWTSVNDVIWLTYVNGQLLVVYSVAAAFSVWR